MRVLVGNDAEVVSPLFTDGDEAAAAADDVEVAIVDIYGETLATVTPTAHESIIGAYVADLTAADHTADLNVLTLDWTGTVAGKVRRYTQTVEVVGGHFATLADLRSGPGQSKWATDELWAARAELEDLAERYRGIAMVPRVSKVTVAYRPRLCEVWLDLVEIRALRSVAVDGVEIDLAGVTLDPNGRLTLTTQPSIGTELVVIVEHGLDTPPEAARRACHEFVKAALGARAGGAPDNVLTWGDGSGATYRSSTADWAAGRPTGWMRCDDALNEIRDRRLPGIA